MLPPITSNIYSGLLLREGEIDEKVAEDICRATPVYIAFASLHFCIRSWAEEMMMSSAQKLNIKLRAFMRAYDLRGYKASSVYIHL